MGPREAAVEAVAQDVPTVGEVLFDEYLIPGSIVGEEGEDGDDGDEDDEGEEYGRISFEFPRSIVGMFAG